MNNFAQFFKRTQVQQIYVVLVCSLLMYAFLYVEISDFRELDYQVEVTLALASGCLVGFVSVLLSYIHYYNLHKNVREKISTQKSLTEIPVTLLEEKNKQREYIEHNPSDKSEFIDDSYLGFALFFSILVLLFMYIFWCLGIVKFMADLLLDTISPSKKYLFMFFSLYVCFSAIAALLSGGIHIFKKK